MSLDQTKATIAEAVRCVRGLSEKIELSGDERKFANEQAVRLCDDIMQHWANHRYRGRKKVRACCVSVALAIALVMADKIANEADGAPGNADPETKGG